MDKKIDAMDRWVKRARIRWVAMDRDGEVYGFAKRPSRNEHYGEWHASSLAIHIGGTDDEEVKQNWASSLRRVEGAK